MKRFARLVPFICLLAASQLAFAASIEKTVGKPAIQSAGALAFGPDGILFVGDALSAAVFAIETGDISANSNKAAVDITGVDAKIAAMLGTTTDDILINDLAVNPISGNAYLSVSRGRGPAAQPVLFKVAAGGEITEVALDNVTYSKAEMPNPPENAEVGEGRRRRNNRLESITDLAFIDGQLYVAGLSNEEFSSHFRALEYPFKDAGADTSVEIYHGSHGQFETRSPIRTFTSYEIDDAPHLLAAYTCTPLVRIPIAMLRPGEKIKGDTIAELGNHNRPLDMIVYSKDGADYVLMANNARGLMKIPMEKVGEIVPIVDRIPDKAGLEYETIEGGNAVVQLDQLDQDRALALVQSESGFNLKTMPLP
jgi:hypothetical protein